MKKIILLTMMVGVLVSGTSEANAYKLVYQKDNRWISRSDNKPLLGLIKEARSNKATYFKVQLPVEKRDLSVGRLIVLRDILEKQLKRGIVLEEIQEASTMNTIVIDVVK